MKIRAFRLALPAALFVLLGLPGPAAAQLPVYEPPRDWKTAAGRTFQASPTGFDGTTAAFRLPNGQRTQMALSDLSPEDQAYLIEWQKKQPIKVVMPEVAGVETSAIKAEVVSEDPKEGKFVYRTQHFEFESDGKFTQSLLREVARNFEATYELLKALPWNIQPTPPSGQYFRAKLLRYEDAYYALGAPQNSGGVYMSRFETFMVPFSSIGLKVVGKSFAKDNDYRSDTLVHELTHQMMHFWLDVLPNWVIEGTAEYAGNLPLRNGKFRVSAAKNGLKDYLEFLKSRSAVPQPYPLEELFFISGKRWNEVLAQNPGISRRMYFTSYLLVYYFMHLEGKGDGQLFIRYLREVDAQRQEIQKYRKALEEFKNQPGVEKFPDGSYRWRGDLKPPEKPAILESEQAYDAFQKRTLGILLNGRSEAELMKEIRSAYARIGIRL